MFGTFLAAGHDKRGRVIELAPPDAELAPKLAIWRNDANVMRYYDLRYDPDVYTDIDHHATWLSLIERSHLALFWTILADSQPIGTTHIDHMYRGNGVYAIMIGFSEYWSSGIGKLVTQAVTHHAFSSRYITDTLRTTVLDDNIGSLKMLVEAGFNLKRPESGRWLAELNYERWQKIYPMSMVLHG
jgi:RimJ/RimL family protein N-acetyltransferase